MANDRVVPVPLRLFDRFADGAEHTEAGEVVCAWPSVAFFHECTESGGCGVKNIDLVLRHDLPKTSEVGVVRHALVHHRDGAVGHRAVNDVRVTGDPADVGRAPVNVAGVVVENVVMRRRRVSEIAACGMQHALRFAGAAGGVKDEQRVLGVHRFGGANGVGCVESVVPPNIAAVCHGDGGAGAFDDENFLDRRRVLDGLVGVGLHWDVEFRAAHAGVLRDDGLALGVVDASDKAVGTECSKHDRVHHTQASTRQHCDGQLGNHLHVNANAIALGQAEVFQCVGCLLYFGLQLSVGERAAFVRVVALPNQRGVVAVPVVHMTIDAVVTGIDFASDEPADLRFVKIRLGQRVPFLDPIKPLGLSRPEFIGVAD